MANNTIFEQYDNIYKFMDIINKRPNNGRFGTQGKSDDSSGWAGTKTYNEAVEQFSNGLPEKCERLKKGLERFKAVSNISTHKPMPKNYYYGHAPNVPAAIIGLPKSMRRVERIPQKVKALSIMVDVTGNANVDASTLEKSGETVLSAAYALELQGYRVRIVSLPFVADCEHCKAICGIVLKDWKQPIDVLKLSFPLTSPAMFRRFGFQWAETLPDVKRRVTCYGCHMEKDKVVSALKSVGINTDNTYFVDVKTCKSVDYDVERLISKLGIKKG